MTTTVVTMDSFDSPMMDYMVDDIAMQIGPSSSSHSWAQPEQLEAQMDDDSAPHFHPEDVEIDMEPYNPENFEYEMTDDGSLNPPGAHEVLDIEVVDATSHPSPSLLDDQPFQMNHRENLSSHQNSPILQPTDTEFIPQAYSETILAPPTSTEEETDLPPLQQQDPGDAILTAPVQDEPQVQSADDLSCHSEVDAVTHQSGELEIPLFSDSAREHVHVQEPDLVYPSNAEHAAGDEHPSKEAVHDQSWVQEQHAQEEVVAHDSTGDPHEISEGIYIDPPPAVLLSLHHSSDTFCLFNLPAAKSASDDTSALVLLLHDFPTLYYEPLSKVFEALRHEQNINHGFDLANGELVIDAYELVDLAISEDNIYSHEVSLHDLNVLHDISDLPGPLHIRLECRVPRFIMRYRYLKAELERLNIEGENKSGAVPVGSGLDEDPQGQEDPQLETEEHWKEHVQSNRSDENEESEYRGLLTEQPEEAVRSGEQDLLDQDSVAQPVIGEREHEEEVEDPDADADGDTDYGSQSALDLAEVCENLDTAPLAPIGGKSTEYKTVVYDNEQYGESFGNSSDAHDGEQMVNETAEGDGDFGGLTYPDDAHSPSNEDFTSGQDGHELERFSGPIDLTGGDDVSDGALREDDTSTEHGSTNKEQVTASILFDSLDGGGGKLDGNDPSNGDLENDSQIDQNFDDFDGAEWDEEDFAGDLNDDEGYKGESVSIDSSSSKTLSSNSSTKRRIEEVDFEEQAELLEILSDSKRQKVL